MDVTQDIKLAILKAIKDKYDGEYRYNILHSAEFGRAPSRIISA